MKKVMVLVIFFTVILIGGNASADMAPIVHPGATIKALKSSDIQMKSEHVRIDIQPDEMNSHYYLYNAKLSAEFVFYNSEEPVDMQVGFPMEDLMSLNLWGDPNMPKEFTVRVNDQEVETENIKLNEASYQDDWIAWDMTFAADETVVEVEYFLPSSGGGYSDMARNYSYYVLETGQGWKDEIESALIEVKFPSDYDLIKYLEMDMVGPRNSVLDLYDPPLIIEPTGYTIEENTVKWDLIDFEPTHEDNIVFGIAHWDVYNNLAYTKDSVKDNTAAEDYFMLARAYLPFARVSKSMCYGGLYKELAEKTLEKVTGDNVFSEEERALGFLENARIYLCTDFDGENAKEVKYYIDLANQISGDSEKVKMQLSNLEQDEYYKGMFPKVEEPVVEEPSVIEDKPAETSDKDLFIIIGSFILLLLVFAVAFTVRNSKK
ncbi:hypothetical protein HOM83_03550 [Candidatus Falkowbacteria bacterium]|nr:hypothetical protein [Candidatus Falkowbacteria bacterium]